MRKKITILINGFVGAMSFGSWGYMALRAARAAMLASSGLSSLKFFTVLSNLLNGAVSLCYAGWLLSGKEITVRKKTVKLMATAAVGLTFLTVMTFLGPLYGYGSMFNGANLWMHLVLPVLSMGSFMFLERDGKIPFRSTGFAALPTVLYAAGYLINIGINGKGTWPESNDFYGFLNWGNGVGAVIAVTIVLITWLIAVVLRAVANKMDTTKE